MSNSGTQNVNSANALSGEEKRFASSRFSVAPMLDSSNLWLTY
ncbi:hypothetical protein P7F88_00885 [Vibrio hannami]|nr:hypothetical protein [Vibrio hannami]MDG3084720.1 hypothetical protein [Vibrio hannami]